jgi:hypothetical protein
MWRIGLVALAVVFGIASVPVVYSLDLRDDRLPAAKAERLLQDRLRTNETAIKVVDGTVEVVSEGHWKLFTRSAVATESGY